jgi:hypothetical protein
LVSIVKGLKQFLRLYLCYFSAVAFLIFSGSQSIGSDSDNIYNIIGMWKFESVKTWKLRVEKGVPWHISDKYGMSRAHVIMKFNKETFQFYNKKTGEIEDQGRYKVIDSTGGEVTLRFFPQDNRFDVNNLRVKELLRFAPSPGDNIPYIFGFRFIDKDSVESFSYVRWFGKDVMVKKDDNAFWRRITELPKFKQKVYIPKK